MSMLRKLNDILSVFTAERQELSAAEIVAALGWPKSTIYRLLSTVEAEGFLDYDAVSARYRLGIRLAALGELARNASSLQRVALPVLKALSDETGETADLTVLVGAEAVTIGVEENFQPIMLPGLLGGRVPVHATAAGKVLLAWMAEEEVAEILPDTLPRLTDATITSPDVLLRDLRRTRQRGYAIVDGEWIRDLIAVAAPVRNRRGEVVAAIAVGGPRFRIGSEKLDRMVEAVKLAGERISSRLGYLGPAGSRSDNAQQHLTPA